MTLEGLHLFAFGLGTTGIGAAIGIYAERCWVREHRNAISRAIQRSHYSMPEADADAAADAVVALLTQPVLGTRGAVLEDSP